ncbi:MAG TPA: DUF222 domain-containing protein [Microthrixaceae bacterium]|nr:DUF222 domain-containing protein [Microthrixaceae bacterium]
MSALSPIGEPSSSPDSNQHPESDQHRRVTQLGDRRSEPGPKRGHGGSGEAPNSSARGVSGVSGWELEGRIRQLGGKLRTLHHKIVTCAAAYDSSGMWAKSGQNTCAGWIADELGVSFGTAREWLRVGHALERLPKIMNSFSQGKLSYSQVRTVTRIATDHPERDEELCDLAEQTPLRQLAVKLAQWCAENEDPEDSDKRHKRGTSLSCRIEPDGMGSITVRLPPLQHRMVIAAIDAQMMTTKSAKRASAGANFALSVSDRPSLSQQRAHAFVQILSNGGAGVNTEVIVHVRSNGTQLEDGTPIDPRLLAELIPKSTIRAMIHNAESHPINVSEKHRIPTKRQKLVVDERQGTCQCGSTAFLDYHHEPPFTESKRTVVDELVRHCGICHRRRHE